MRKDLKICAGASAGGHMNQLLKLLDAADGWPVQPAFYVTTMDVLAAKLSARGPVYVIGECNRRHPLQSLSVFFKAAKLVNKERPDVVITTGSMPIALVCLCAKIRGAKIIWIDSIANAEKLSMSGAFVRRFADLFLTQWPELTEKINGIEFSGALV